MISMDVLRPTCGKFYSTDFYPCHLTKNHEDDCAFFSIKDSKYLSINMESDGRPTPKKTWEKDYHWCSETGDYRHVSICVDIKGPGHRIIWPGKDELGFAYYERDGFTVARIYHIKSKAHLSTKYFNGTISKEQIRGALFNGVTPQKEALLSARGGGKPFKATYKHVVLTKADFDRKFRQNTYRHIGYNTNQEDATLKSIGQILINADGGEEDGGTISTAINNVFKRIRTTRQNLLKLDNTLAWPCVEVYAVWSNYDIDATVLYEKYDSVEPLFYQYNIFHSPEEMNEHPL